MESLQSGHRPILLQINLLMNIPPPSSPPIPREEHVHLRSRPSRGRKRHADAVRLLAPKLIGKGLAAVRVVGILMPVISMDGETPTVPARHAEGWVG